MHAQGRSKPAKSPADLAAFLEVLAGANVNITAAGGSNLESGGEFAFALEHADGDNGPYDAAVLALVHAGYTVRLIDSEADDRLSVYTVANQPGTLRDCVVDTKNRNAPSNRIIKDIAIGLTDTGEVRVQIFSEDPSD